MALMTEEGGFKEEGEEMEHEGSGLEREGSIGEESSMVMMVETREG